MSDPNIDVIIKSQSLQIYSWKELELTDEDLQIYSWRMLELTDENLLESR
jgi:hypothetical protein